MQTRQKIIDSAMKEFGEKSYSEGSLNSICTIGKISKGIIYHYFRDKDELYLICVKETFDALTQFLGKVNFTFNQIESDIDSYMSARFRFFNEHKDYSNIFFNAVLQPPVHLQNKIKEIKSAFDKQSTAFYRKTLENITLRNDILIEEAIEYFIVFQEMYNGYFQSKAHQNSDFHLLVESHEMKLSKLLGIMLYGVAQKPNIEKREK